MRPARGWDDGGQASVEYILMLATVALLFLILVKLFFKPVIQKLLRYIGARIDNVFMNGNLHRLPFKR